MTDAVSRIAEPDATISVIIVDDSVVVRGLFSRWLAELPEIRIVGIHRNGLEAVRQIAQSRPDIVILDIEMPEMDGLTALPLLLEASPGSKVLVVSGMSIRGADITLRCLMRGASDYLAKPTSISQVSTSAEFREALVASVRALGGRRGGISDRDRARAQRAGVMDAPAPQADRSLAPAQSPLPPADLTRLRVPSSQRPELLVIGASTGGPPAIAAFLGGMRAALAELPVVVVQHMPATFTMLFADHLRRHSQFDACEVGGGETLRPGVVHVCRGGQNLEIQRAQAGLVLKQRFDPQPTRWQPSADILFSSAAETLGRGVLGVVLTGMGDDGVIGCMAIANAGGTVLAQDEASSVVWGMPGAVVRAGVASMVRDPQGLARFAARLVGGANAAT